MARTDWHRYFMDMAIIASSRSTCDRRHVGCVITVNRQVISTGYNGSAPGEPHCDDVGHLMVDGHCVRTIHAEANAIAQAAKRGVSLEGGVAYVNTRPCWNCVQLLNSAGVRTILFAGEYGVKYPADPPKSTLLLPLEP